MKKLNILLVFALSLLAFAACSNDELKLNEGDKTAPVFSNFECDQDFEVLPTTNQKEVIGSMTWTEATFGIKSPITYAFVLDTLESMVTAVEVSKFTTHSEPVDITIEMLNKAASQMKQESGPVTVYVGIKAYLGSVGSVGALYTAIQKVSFTCYFYNPKDPLYIVGDGLIGWDNAAASIGKDLQIFFADNSGKADLIYTYTGKFLGDKGLKFPTIAGDWDTAYGYNGTTLVANGGDNYTTPTGDGIYTLTVDLNALSVSMTKYTGTETSYEFIGIVGDGAAGWPDDNNVTDVLMTEVVSHVWVATGVELTEGKEIKFRADKAWGTDWGASSGDNQELPYAIGVKSGSNIKVTKSGKHYIAFNDLTGHYAIIYEDDLPQKAAE